LANTNFQLPKKFLARAPRCLAWHPIAGCKKGDSRQVVQRVTAKMKPRVLLIDDEPSVVDTLAQILAAGGYEVQVEYSGDAGVERATIFRPDIVISDVIMPTTNGVDAAIDIQRRLPNCRILLLSAAPDYARHMLKSRRHPGFEVMAKPISPRCLLSRLSAA
jgi:two-component system alkaline phosphatase synthesis response regulator PhoP